MIKQIIRLLTKRPERGKVTTRPENSVRVVGHPANEEWSNHRNPIRVQVDQRSLWAVRGWRHDPKSRMLVGAFRTPVGSFIGNIQNPGSKRPLFFIRNPPEALLQGSHAACFRPRGQDGWFYVHFGITSPEIDSGILGIESLILESLQRNRTQKT